MKSPLLQLRRAVRAEYRETSPCKTRPAEFVGLISKLSQQTLILSQQTLVLNRLTSELNQLTFALGNSPKTTGRHLPAQKTAGG
ncbi:MAG: hypothetical protein QY332_13660 [Anaerolineales bacterium]|nr:MAG: hypothetical protein QY332_13660 [Anaerolineales bacterium]